MKRRELIISGIDSKLLRIQHLEFEKNEGDNWVIIPNLNEESRTTKKWLHRSANVLTVNARSLLDLNRWTSFANSLSNCDIVRITETWLTAAVANEALFLPFYFIYRKDRKITDFKSKHGGVLIAVKSSLKHKNVDISLIHDNFIVIKINFSMSFLIICCIYNAPEQSNYRWAANDFLNLLEKLKNYCGHQFLSCAYRWHQFYRNFFGEYVFHKRLRRINFRSIYRK